MPLSEARWLAPGASVDSLLNQPGECVTDIASPPLWESVQIGRVAFRAPLLLGGQAARAWLSCASCHRNGRGNPDFHFPGISGAAGTADVTASLLSSHRGDGEFNPKPIPDLADETQAKVSRDHRRDDLRKFIRGLIVEEFDGPEPPQAVLQGLVDYVQFMDPAKCGAGVRITLGDALKDIESAIWLAQTLAAHDDEATAKVMIAAARSSLGRIDERFSVPGLERERVILGEAAKELGRIQQALGTSAEPQLWKQWSARWPARKRALVRGDPRSLYSPAVLRRLVEVRP